MGISKSKQKSQSSSTNQAYPFLQGALGGSVSSVGDSISALQALLSGDSSGFDAYKAATGFNGALSQGLEGVTGAEAAKGLLRSGSAGKAFETYGDNLENQYAQNYLSNLVGVGQLGLGAGQILGGAGNTSQSTESNKSKALKGPDASFAWGG